MNIQVSRVNFHLTTSESILGGWMEMFENSKGEKEYFPPTTLWSRYCDTNTTRGIDLRVELCHDLYRKLIVNVVGVSYSSEIITPLNKSDIWEAFLPFLTESVEMELILICHLTLNQSFQSVFKAAVHNPLYTQPKSELYQRGGQSELWGCEYIQLGEE